MKFFKQYREYMEGHERDLPGVEFKHLKKILKHCRSEVDSEDELSHFDNHNPSNCPHHCPVCDGTFFPCLLKEMSEVVACFNDHVKELLHIHLATGLRKCFLFLTGKTKKDHGFMIQECQDLVTYALINAIAVRKILKKYDKIHYSKQGQAFKSQAQRMRIEILQSPWLCELMAFHVNLREENIKKQMGGAALFDGCSLTFFDGKPALTCEIFDAMRVDIDLRCAICLDTVFDPVSLTCGHIFCYICACSAASVTIVDGLKSAAPHNKCPKCREAAVYEGAVRLTELNMLLKRRCREYWEERLQSERQERLRLAKEHYVMQHRSFVGF